MSLKLEFLFPNITSASRACKAMLLERINHKHMFFIAKDDAVLGNLNPANVFQKTDTLHEAYRGIFVGAGLGLLAGLLALAFPPWYNNADWSVILSITTLSGILTGVLGMALLGTCLSNSDYDKFSERIAKGQILMIIQVPISRARTICKKIDGLFKPKF